MFSYLKVLVVVSFEVFGLGEEESRLTFAMENVGHTRRAGSPRKC
jgi:hypothetical protein